MSKILITGSNGLAGTAISEHLAKRGHEVIAHTRAMCDLRDPSATTRMFTAYKPDVVVHMAALVFGLGGNMQKQGRAIHENTMINTNVIHSARPCKRFIAMGT